MEQPKQPNYFVFAAGSSVLVHRTFIDPALRDSDLENARLAALQAGAEEMTGSCDVYGGFFGELFDVRVEKLPIVYQLPA